MKNFKRCQNNMIPQDKDLVKALIIAMGYYRSIHIRLPFLISLMQRLRVALGNTRKSELKTIINKCLVIHGKNSIR